MLTIGFTGHRIKIVARQEILEGIYSAIKERNKQIALQLSLVPNSPDIRGRNRIEQERDRLEQSRTAWENANSLQVNERVLIPAGTPVGLGILGFYVTGKPIEGVLAVTHSLHGGSGYMEHGHRTREALARITIELPFNQGQASAETVELLVVNDMLEAVKKEFADSSSNAQIAA